MNIEELSNRWLQNRIPVSKKLFCLFASPSDSPAYFFAVFLSFASLILFLQIRDKLESFRKHNNTDLRYETNYLYDFEAYCPGSKPGQGTYFITKYSFFTSTVGSEMEHLYSYLRKIGLDVSYQEIGTNATLGWWFLFKRHSPQSLEATQHLHSTIQDVVFEKVALQVSDPIWTISVSQKFCSDEKTWALVSSVTPFLKFYSYHLYGTTPIQADDRDRCIRLLMYHWLSWNRIIKNFADLTYLAETTTFSSICSRSFEDFPELIGYCSEDSSQETIKYESMEASHYIIDVNQLYRVDCELANQVFYLAIEFGYEKYEFTPRKCGFAEA